MKPKSDLSPRTYKLLFILNVVVAACCVIIGGFDVYFHEWVPAVCMYVIFAFAAYNAYLFYDRTKKD